MKHRTLITINLWFLLRILLSNLTFASESASSNDTIHPPGFATSWLDGQNVLRAGDTATIKIKVMDSNNSDLYPHPEKYMVRFTLSVNGRKGNSSYVSGVSASPEADPTNWNITFIPIIVGNFTVIIDDYRSGTRDRTLHFNVTAGKIHESVSIASWMNLVNEFVAGTKANVIILPKDAFGNDVSLTSEESDSCKFMASISYENGSAVSLDITFKSWNEVGYIGFEFLATISGSFLLHVEGRNQSLNGSPLLFKVRPGPLSITNCVAKWSYETNALQIFSKLEIFIHQQDWFGNLVPILFPFDARVVEKAMNLSIPVSDIYFEEASQGIQLLSFTVSEPGNFTLTIFDDVGGESISNMPYEYTVFVGYCDGFNSVVNGSGLASSVAGKMSSFSVYLEDKYHYPSPVDAERLRVQIIRKIDSYNVQPTIHPMVVDGYGQGGQNNYGAGGHVGSAPALSVDLNNTASSFDVIYTLEKSGIYEIWVFCGNIPLNGGLPYALEAFPGMVDASQSSIVKFVPRVAKHVINELVVQLMDSFSNPVTSQQKKLSFEIDPIRNSSFLRWDFIDNKDGSYFGYYLPTILGTYKISILFEDKHLSPSPFEISVHEREYFPKAYNYTISVWENESIAFHALENYYSAYGIMDSAEILMPRFGSLLQYGQIFRYTPYKGFFGNDSFSYTISDKNKNVDTGTVTISVLSSPPQFLSLPNLLQVTEDVIGPSSGGFCGFKIKYSDQMDNISITLSALSGTIFLAPMPMQCLELLGGGRSVNKEVKDLILVGRVEVINSALQFIQYLGDENFYGSDFINISTMNKNGIQDTHVPIFVEPINDPPFICVPEYILLEWKGTMDYLQIFDIQKDKFEFSIGDPDFINFTGNKSHFVVVLSMEVSAGTLKTTLPIDLINATELKLENSNQWLPLPNFVKMSNHFVIKGKGVRLRGSIKDCNDAMRQLLYRGEEHGAVLSVSVNDMGNYGCYPDCTQKTSSPLFAEATVNLIKRRPMNSLLAHTLGSAIITEFVTMLFLGTLLLFFICKCAIALANERRRLEFGDSKHSKLDDFNKPTFSASASENMTYFTGCSTSFLLRRQCSNFRQRSNRLPSHEESINDRYCSTRILSDDHCQLSPPTGFVPLAIERGDKGKQPVSM
ncbi:protein GAMETE EXPRESSED 2 isoform X2 [Magnolia sinica]|uniref:protein GAMETE EXPRESSED 2 isoform X2 n=1 Tax=Magnolia sinica TaxID=86752 RepID=UPI00265B2935|nr:protein GAMETE EXPRESSED 2 isoform X2 [Magnolia sinica]